MTDENGNEVARYVYDSFGRPALTMSHVSDPFLHTGREHDMETGMYYYKATD